MASRNKRTGSGNLQNPRPTKSRVRNVKPKQVDGINFRSTLEAFCYRKLKDGSIPADYEKHKYLLLEGFHYTEARFEDNGKTGYIDRTEQKVRDITYTPDFVDPKGRWIIECKGYANERFPMKWKMFMKHLIDTGQPLPKLFVPRNQSQVLKTIEEIQKLIAPTF